MSMTWSFCFPDLELSCFFDLMNDSNIVASVIIAEIVVGVMICFIDLTAKPIMTPLIILLRSIAVIAVFINRISIAIECKFGC
jgi:hypothetical protein